MSENVKVPILLEDLIGLFTIMKGLTTKYKYEKESYLEILVSSTGEEYSKDN